MVQPDARGMYPGGGYTYESARDMMATASAAVKAAKAMRFRCKSLDGFPKPELDRLVERAEGVRLASGRTDPDEPRKGGQGRLERRDRRLALPDPVLGRAHSFAKATAWVTRDKSTQDTSAGEVRTFPGALPCPAGGQPENPHSEGEACVSRGSRSAVGASGSFTSDGSPTTTACSGSRGTRRRADDSRNRHQPTRALPRPA